MPFSTRRAKATRRSLRLTTRASGRGHGQRAAKGWPRPLLPPEPPGVAYPVSAPRPWYPPVRAYLPDFGEPQHAKFSEGKFCALRPEGVLRSLGFGALGALRAPSAPGPGPHIPTPYSAWAAMAHERRPCLRKRVAQPLPDSTHGQPMARTTMSHAPTLPIGLPLSQDAPP
jgi:hypothetical protein